MISILKIPFDLGILEEKRRGAANAPDLILAEIKRIYNKQLHQLSVPVNLGNFEQTQQNIENAALKEYAKGRCVIGIGGDHSVSFGLIRAFAQHFKGKVGLIYLDAHPDCQDHFLPPSHEDILRDVIIEGIIPAKNVLLVGVRRWTKQEKKFVAKEKFRFIRAQDLLTKSQSWLADQVTAFAAKLQHLYISLDIDVLDPKIAPGTGWPEPHGLTERQLISVLRVLIKSGKVRGLDITEVCPSLDADSATVSLAARLLKPFLTSHSH